MDNEPTSSATEESESEECTSESDECSMSSAEDERVSQMDAERRRCVEKERQVRTLEHMLFNDAENALVRSLLYLVDPRDDADRSYLQAVCRLYTRRGLMEALLCAVLDEETSRGGFVRETVLREKSPASTLLTECLRLLGDRYLRRVLNSRDVRLDKRDRRLAKLRGGKGFEARRAQHAYEVIEAILSTSGDVPSAIARICAIVDEKVRCALLNADNADDADNADADADDSERLRSSKSFSPALARHRPAGRNSSEETRMTAVRPSSTAPTGLASAVGASAMPQTLASSPSGGLRLKPSRSTGAKLSHLDGGSPGGTSASAALGSTLSGNLLSGRLRRRRVADVDELSMVVDQLDGIAFDSIAGVMFLRWICPSLVAPAPAPPRRSTSSSSTTAPAAAAAASTTPAISALGTFAAKQLQQVANYGGAAEVEYVAKMVESALSTAGGSTKTENATQSIDRSRRLRTLYRRYCASVLRAGRGRILTRSSTRSVALPVFGSFDNNDLSLIREAIAKHFDAVVFRISSLMTDASAVDAVVESLRTVVQHHRLLHDDQSADLSVAVDSAKLQRTHAEHIVLTAASAPSRPSFDRGNDVGDAELDAFARAASVPSGLHLAAPVRPSLLPNRCDSIGDVVDSLGVRNLASFEPPPRTASDRGPLPGAFYSNDDSSGDDDRYDAASADLPAAQPAQPVCQSPVDALLANTGAMGFLTAAPPSRQQPANIAVSGAAMGLFVSADDVDQSPNINTTPRDVTPRS
jgi:hypothetical protein